MLHCNGLQISHVVDLMVLWGQWKVGLCLLCEPVGMVDGVFSRCSTVVDLVVIWYHTVGLLVLCLYAVYRRRFDHVYEGGIVI